jgi:hypothetical protein
MSGGLFQGAESNVQLDVLVIDELAHENPRATLPGRPGEIWAGLEAADVDAASVNAAFDGLTWRYV